MTDAKATKKTDSTVYVGIYAFEPSTLPEQKRAGFKDDLRTRLRRFHVHVRCAWRVLQARGCFAQKRKRAAQCMRGRGLLRDGGGDGGQLLPPARQDGGGEQATSRKLRAL